MTNNIKDTKNNFTIIAILCVAIFCWQLPTPNGMALNAWHLLIIFIATIVGIILNPLPMGVVSLLSILSCVMTETLTLPQTLSGFSDAIVWLVLFAFFISNGFIKTGLGSRIAYYVISKIGHSTLGLSYALVIADFILAPLIPSASARGGGIMYPIAKSLCKSFADEDHPGVSSRNGGFLMVICGQSNVITSTLFVTAMAANPLAVKLAANAGFIISWTDWALAAIVPGILCLMTMPLLVYYLYPPSIKHSDTAPQIAKEKLQAMGRISFDEIIMLFVFILLVVLWMLGNKLHLSATTVSLVGLAVLLVSHVVNFEDNLGDKTAWHTFLWFATLIMLSDFLSKFGLMDMVSKKITIMFADTSPTASVITLSIIYFYIHYLFASTTAHITVLFPTFLLLFVDAGVPGITAALALSFLSTLSSGLTHFGLSSMPIFFGAGYMKTKSWWYIGLITSFLYIFIWVTIGGTWWKIINLW